MGLDLGWRRKAKCGEQPFFFPREHRRRPIDIEATARAKNICAECPVRRDCLEFALEGDIRYGIWGGFTHRERLKIKAARRALEKQGEMPLLSITG